MSINTEQLNVIARFNYRVNNLARELANYHPEHDMDNLSIKWEFDNDDNPLKVIITLASYDYRNTSCHCHPEYELHTKETRHEIPLEEIVNDDYFLVDSNGVYDDVMYDHPAVERMQAEIKAENERKEAEVRRKKEEDELRRKLAQERIEREQLARLQAKYQNV